MPVHGERRRFGKRDKTFLRAQFAGTNGSPIGDCVVVDLSDTGARLFLSGSDELPEQFWLTIQSRKFKALVELVHRQGETVGVKFIGPKTVL